MREVLFGSMMDRRCSIGTLLLTTVGMTHQPNRACDKHDALECLLLRLVYEYLAAMQFNVCTPLRMRVDSL
jgi:hypothetical protein